MSQFQKSYKDTIRNLKLEKKEDIEYNQLFNSYLLPIKNSSELNNFIKINEYKSANSQLIDFTKQREKDYYDNIIKYLPSIIDDQFIDSDYLTGLYFNKMLKLKNSSCFIAGFVKDAVLRGLSYNNIIKYYGCDKIFNPSNKRKYINGIARKCDVHDINSVRSINLQMGEHLPVKSLDLYLCDIKANTYQDLLCSYLIQHSFMKLKCIVILRMPNTLELNSIYNLLSFFTNYYKNVSIFKTPWGINPKYYIILKEQKKEIDSAKHNKLIIYAKNKIDYIFDDYINPEELSKLKDNILHLINHEENNTDEIILNDCLELIK
jgi:hypothetical protein